MAVATASATGGIERHAVLDRLLQRLEDGLGQPLALDFFVEDVYAEEVLDVDFAEIHALKFMASGGNGLAIRN